MDKKCESHLLDSPALNHLFYTICLGKKIDDRIFCFSERRWAVNTNLSCGWAILRRNSLHLNFPFFFCCHTNCIITNLKEFQLAFFRYRTVTGYFQSNLSFGHFFLKPFMIRFTNSYIFYHTVIIPPTTTNK